MTHVIILGLHGIGWWIAAISFVANLCLLCGLYWSRKAALSLKQERDAGQRLLESSKLDVVYWRSLYADQKIKTDELARLRRVPKL